MSRDTGFFTWRLVVGVVGTSCLLLSFACAADQGTGEAAYAWQKEILARVGAIQGDTKVQRAGEAQFKKIAVKAPLYVMDYVSTGKNSKLWWHGTFNAYTPSDKWKPGPDVTHGSLGADSVFGFKQFTRAGASYRFVGYVKKGTVRLIKTLPRTNPPSTYNIGTHTAWIEVLESDRAADFIVESKNETLTTVTVLWGKIRVKNVSPDIKESRILTSCQEVDVERDQEPGEIKWVSTDTMKELVKRTTIPRTLPEDVPSCERLKTEVLLDVTAVFLPPPGVALYPPIVPVPVSVPGDKSECCPPGKIYDPRTGECRCPCPEGERPPVVPRGGNGLLFPIGPGPCGSCRQGATFNPQTCSCECPCPQGFLLPGTGCVQQCPAGYSQLYDASNSPPYRCLYCVPTGVVTDPVPPPLRPCQEVQPRGTNGSIGDCDPCEVCVDGTCRPRVCREGEYLDRFCKCSPLEPAPQPCQYDFDCPLCFSCNSGRCLAPEPGCPEGEALDQFCRCGPPESAPQPCQSQTDCDRCDSCIRQRCLVPELGCREGERRNSVNCRCEPEDGYVVSPTVPGQPEVRPRTLREPPPGCRNNRDCPEGEICRGGKCVKKPPPVEPRQLEVTIPDPIEEDPSVQELRRDLEDGDSWPSFGIGIGIGGGRRGGGSPGGGQRVAPVQRVPRAPKPR